MQEELGRHPVSQHPPCILRVTLLVKINRVKFDILSQSQLLDSKCEYSVRNDQKLGSYTGLLFAFPLAERGTGVQIVL